MNLKITALATAVFLQLAGAAAAAPVLVVNHSFEVPALADGEFTPNFAPTALITGWTVSAGAGVFNPTAGQLSQGPTDDDQVGYSNEVGLAFQQDLAAALVLNTVYTLMVDLQSRSDGFPNPGATIELRTAVDNDLLATASFGLLAGGTNQLLTATFTSGEFADPNVGEFLRINLIGAGIQSVWDNVRLDATPAVNGVVPEPGTLWLLGAALIGVGALRRKL